MGFDLLLRPIMNRLRGLVRRGLVKRVDEAPKMRELQVAAGFGDLRDRVEHLEPYGFTSSPLPEAEALLVNVGADRSHTVAAVVADRRHRVLGLSPGDVALHPAGGATVILRANGGIEIVSAQPIQITTPELRVQGNIKATGDVSDGVRSMAADRLIFNSHTHSGIEPGSGVSGPPTVFEETGGEPNVDFALHAFEIPPELLTGAARGMGVLRIRGDADAGTASVWISTDNVDYTEIHADNQYVTGGTLVEAFDASDLDIEDGPIIHVQGPDWQALLLHLRAVGWELGRQLLKIDDEWMYLRDAEDLGGDNWRLKGIRRGRFRSTVATHAIGSVAFVVDPTRMAPYYDPLVRDGQLVFVKTQPRSATGAVPLLSVTPASTTFAVTGPHDAQWVFRQVPAGAIDGTNAVFVLPSVPSPSTSLLLLKNGMGMKQGEDYTLAGDTITFLTGAIPRVTATLLAHSYQIG